MWQVYDLIAAQKLNLFHAPLEKKNIKLPVETLFKNIIVANNVTF